jgi:secretion/DNA translocation related CpaE-like protein
MSAGIPGPPASVDASVLLVSRDLALIDELYRLAAAAGSHIDVASDAETARVRWGAAAGVLVGPDTVDELAATAPVRREGVHVVSLGPVPDAVFPAALAVGAESVVELPAAETWLVETLTDTADGAPGRAPVVGVVGGCGGAGATTFATALAQAAAAEGHPVTLVDADPMGAGIERIAGIDDARGATWSTLVESAGRLGSRSLRAALPQSDGLAVLGWGDESRCELDPPTVREVLSAARRGSALVLVDLPRQPTQGARELLRRVDDLVVVTPLNLPGVAAAAHVVRTQVPDAARAHLVARGPASGLDPEEVARLLGLPLAAAMTDERRLAEAVELGTGPLSRRRGPLVRAVRATLARVERPAATPGVSA